MSDFIERDGQEVFEEEYLEFAGYNIQRRAIPDARDGLKWGARQLLYSQNLGKLTYDKPFKKAIKSVSHAMGFCYLHGDASAYGTLIRMAKPFAYRYPLQEANGNYGTLINPTDHSASRYVELRGSELASYMLTDIDKETISEWEDTYDLEGQFPKVLPSKGFYSIVNGCIGIGSGMGCSIPPTNLTEVNNALIKLLNNPDIDLTELVCMPDFPTGGILLNASEVRQSLLVGSGHACKVRARIAYNSKEHSLIVQEMPYSTYTNTICNQLAELISDNPDCGIKDFDDFTGEKPNLHIYLTKEAKYEEVLKLLYKETSLQTSYSINIIVLDNGIKPKLFGWKDALQAHLDHEKVVYRKGFEYDIRQLEHRKHILDGYLIVLADIEEVVKLIKGAESAAIAKVELMKHYLLDDEQATAVLKLTLSRLAHLEVEKIHKELAEIVAEIERITTILNDTKLFNKEIENGLRAVIKKYGDKRRTEILDIEGEADDITELKTYQVSITNRNNVYVQEYSTLCNSNKLNKLKLGPAESIEKSVIMTNKQRLFLVNDAGEYTTTLINKFGINKCTKLPYDCHIAAMAPINAGATHIVMVTEAGVIKKTAIGEYNFASNRWMKGITLADGDKCVGVEFCQSNDNITILTNERYILSTSLSELTTTGRVSKGVKISKLNAKEKIISTHITSTANVIVLAKDGTIKRFDGVAQLSARTARGKRLTILEPIDFVDATVSAAIALTNTTAYIVDTTTATTINKTMPSEIAKVLLPKI